MGGLSRVKLYRLYFTTNLSFKNMKETNINYQIYYRLQHAALHYNCNSTWKHTSTKEGVMLGNTIIWSRSE